MRTLRAAVSVIAASLLSPLLAVAPASAAPQWTPPEALDSSGRGVDIAVNDAGTAVALWSTGGETRASFRPAGQNWGRPEVVSRDGSFSWVFINRRGIASAVGIGQGHLRVSDRLPDGRWKADKHAPTYQIGGACGDAYYAADSDPAGDIVLSWTETQCEGSYSHGGVAWRFADGSWGRVHEEEGDGGLPVDALAVHDGVATLVGEYGAPGVWVRTSTKGGKPTDPQTLLDAVGTPDIASNTRGDIVVGVTESPYSPGNETSRLVTRTKPAGQEWQPAQASPWKNGSAGPASVSINDDGATAVVFPGGQSTRHQVLVSEGRVAGGEWTEPSSVAGDLPYPVATTDVAVGSDGALAVGWSTNRSGGSRTASTQVSYRPPGQPWEPAVELAGESKPGHGWRDVEMVAYPNGMFTAVLADESPMYSDHVDDTVAPTTRVVAPPKDFVVSTRIPVRWRATDELARVRNIDVRVRSARRTGGFSKWSMWRRRTTDSAAPFAGEPGRTYCFSVRARDRVGNLGAWSPERCATTPVDDRAFVASGAWTQTDSRSAYQRTLTTTTKAGARLRLDDVTATTLRLAAVTCPGCGKVRVTHAGRELGVFDLRSRRTRQKQVIVLGDFASERRGALTLRAASSGKPVSIDGIIASR